jgi:Fic family protein
MSTNADRDSYSNRAGSYILQPAGYRAFIPRPLPPNPPPHLDDEMLLLLSQADRALGRLDGTTEILPNPDLFVAMYVQKEAVLSSQIEGTQASLIDVLAFEADAAQPTNPQDIAEVVNYVAALNYGLDRLQKLPLSLRLMREIHERLLAGVRGAERRPGEFRAMQNWIGYEGSPIERATFVPPPVAEMQTALADIEAFLHSDLLLPPLIKVGLVHAQFETIHPFLDGNGRMGRLLITFILCQQQILQRPLLYLSNFFKTHKQEYYQLLQRIRDEGDWESWLKFFLRGVCEVAQEATENARKIVQMREQHRGIIMQHFKHSAGAGLKLLEHLYQRPIVTVKGATEITGQQYPNANNLIAKFQEHGILKEMTQQQRNRRFIYSEYVFILASEEMHSQEQASNQEKAEVTHTDIGTAEV